MGIDTKGTVLAIFETKQVSERFTKREFVVETADNPKYPQPILFQITGDKTSQLDGVNVGDEVRVDFSVRGRAWKSNSGETKYFNSLDVWKVEVVKAAGPRTGGGGWDGGSDPNDIPFASAQLAHEPSPIARVMR